MTMVWMVVLLQSWFLNNCFVDTVFPTWLRTAVNTVIRKLIRSTQVNLHWRGPHLLNIVVLVVADALFGLCGSERVDELFISTRPPTPDPRLPLFPVPNKTYGLNGRKAP